MPQKTATRPAAEPKRLDPDDQLAWTFETLSRKTNVPEYTLREMSRNGTGPRVTLIGRRKLVLPRDAKQWLEELRAATEA